MKSDRLLSILLLLQTRGLVPATELAERFEVSVRTIYRDIEALSASGVPVYAERGRHGGIALLPGFRTDVTGLTADEARALFVLAAEGAHAALGLDEALGSALRKVMAALPEPHRPAAELTSRRILVDPVRWMSGPQSAVDVAELHEAVFADRRLRLDYRHSGTSAPRTYTVDPYGLVVKAGVWYLVADRDGVPRLFRADRVRRTGLTDEPVVRRPGVELADLWDELRRQVEERPGRVRLRVRVHRSRLDLFVRLHAGALTGEPRPEGPGRTEGQEAGGEWLRAELAVDSVEQARSLLSFGPNVEVLSPPEARDVLARHAAAVVALYGEAGTA
ncbi:YafY family transcriptional regulator [Streptomyces sp. NBC_01591]|uniref:helix-turn-helix transcriptional regulator n=1 Tax=Streptomyces sp. NBC_01591 TaxID=2975888 RepID=UPI002DD81B09|nr:YafY family protein [Streptomyces sp. NBC_01591]WSD71026.1 YafY family transcriptional regulator [Streptomyces sp. NBC_01591]